jgi:TRAP transporter TAXI family solute receptor
MTKRPTRRISRREAIHAAGTAGLATVAGCVGGGSGGSDENNGSSGGNNSGIQLNLAGGATSSAGYNMGTGYSQLLREENADLSINAQSTGGTTANVRLIGSNYDFGTTTSTDLINGVDVAGPYQEKYELHQIFSFAVLPIPICTTTTEHEDINYIEDLVGTTMGGSPPGTPDAPTLKNYLKANGLWKGEETIEFRRIGRDQGLRELAQGKVAATAGYAVNNAPPPWMNEWLNRRDNAKLLFPKSEENVQNFTKAQPGGVDWDLQLKNFGTGWKNSAYSNQDSVLTTAVAEPYATTPDLSEEAAYSITKNAFKYKDKLPEYHDLWTGFSNSPIELGTLFDNERIPYHPGAAKALKEEGVTDLTVAKK